MEVYLIRHAEAADKADDAQRNLTEKGRRDADALADALKPLIIQVRAIWHSGKPRALQTAEAVVAALQCGGSGLVEHRGIKSMDPVKPIARVLEDYDDNIMIVGHEPFLGRLAARLVTGRASNPLVSLSKPSALCIRRDDRDRQWRIVWMLSDEVLFHPDPLEQSTADEPAQPVEDVASLEPGALS